MEEGFNIRTERSAHQNFAREYVCQWVYVCVYFERSETDS